MSLIYLPNGTPLDIVKRRAKKRSKANGIALSTAQQITAAEHGFQNWPELKAKCIHIHDEPHEFFFDRHIGGDVVCYDFVSFADDPDAYGGGDQLRFLPALFVARIPHWDYEEGVLRIDVVFEPRPIARVDLREYSIFQPRQVERLDLIQALDLVITEGKPGWMIQLMEQAGFFDVDPYVELHAGEFESLLEVQLRESGVHIGKRVIFNLGHCDERESVDFQRRCFINELSDGRYIVSNGAEHVDQLIYRVISPEQFKQLSEALDARFDGNPMRFDESEAWARAMVMPEADPLPGTLV